MLPFLPLWRGRDGCWLGRSRSPNLTRWLVLCTCFFSETACFRAREAHSACRTRMWILASFDTFSPHDPCSLPVAVLHLHQQQASMSSPTDPKGMLVSETNPAVYHIILRLTTTKPPTTGMPLSRLVTVRDRSRYRAILACNGEKAPVDM